MADYKNTMSISVRIYDETAGVDATFSADSQAAVSVAEKKTVTLTLAGLTYDKQINQPCYVKAEVQLGGSAGISLQQLSDFFVGKKVDLTHSNGNKPIAVNYFIYMATPKEDGIGTVTLSLDIYSLDKLLDIVKYSRSYTARKLRAEILPDAIARCKFQNLAVPLAVGDKQQFLAYGKDKEYIQPYVVQYNETAYSMLSRTANRCGEFFYFEEGALHMGLAASSLTDDPVEVKNADGGLRYLSVAYSNSVSSQFGCNQDFHSYNYRDPSKSSAKDALQAVVEGADSMSLALQAILASICADYDNSTKYSETVRFFLQNEVYYQCYYKAKSAHAAYVHYSKEIDEKTKQMGTYDYNTVTEYCSDNRLKEEFVPYITKLIADKEQDLQTAIDEQKKNDYYRTKQYIDSLAQKEADALEAYQKAVAEDSDDKNDLLIAYQDAVAAHENEVAKYQPSIEERIKQEDDKIAGLRKELVILNNHLAEWQSGTLSADSMERIFNNYKDAINEVLKAQYKILDEERNNLDTARKGTLEEPDIFTPYKNKGDAWEQFNKWEEVIKATDKVYVDRIDYIWKTVLDSGKNRFPIDVKTCVAQLKQATIQMKQDINAGQPTVLTDEKSKDIVLLYCDVVINYCDMYDKAMEKTDDSAADVRLGVYDLEYSSDDYLEVVKKDGVGSYTDIYYSGLNQNQSASAYAAFTILQIFSQFFNATSRIAPFLGKIAGTQAVSTATAGISLSLLHSMINDNFINNYKLNGESAKSGDFSDGKNMSLFTTYNRDIDNSDAKEKGMSEMFASGFYKAVLAAERTLTDKRITIRVACSTNTKEPQVGARIKYNGNTYIITRVYGSLALSQTVNGEIPVLEQTVEAIPVYYNSLILPVMIEDNRFCKSEPQVAVVTADNDPDYAGRVRVRFLWQSDSDESSPWLRVSTPYATKGGGMFFIPQVGDQVMLDFEHGNVEHPFVVSSLYNKDITPPTPISKAVNRQTISSKNGHSISLIDRKNLTFITEAFCTSPAMATLGSFSNLGADNSAAGGIVLSDSFGFYKIECNADKRNITIASPFGDIAMSSFTGINISAPNGDVKINAKNIELAAGNEVKISSGGYLKEQIDSAASPASIGATIASGIVGGVVEAALGIIDLSLLRHIVERFARPVSASLMIKSYGFILVDAGDTDFDCDTIADTNTMSYKAAHKKGWKAGLNGNRSDMYSSDVPFKSKAKDFFKTIGSMISQELQKQIYRIGNSVVPEKNKWKIESSKDAIILAGNVFRTGEEKIGLEQVDILSEAKPFAEDKGVNFGYEAVNAVNNKKALLSVLKEKAAARKKMTPEDIMKEKIEQIGPLVPSWDDDKLPNENPKIEDSKVNAQIKEEEIKKAENKDDVIAKADDPADDVNIDGFGNSLDNFNLALDEVSVYEKLKTKVKDTIKIKPKLPSDEDIMSGIMSIEQ